MGTRQARRLAVGDGAFAGRGRSSVLLERDGVVRGWLCRSLFTLNKISFLSEMLVKLWGGGSKIIGNVVHMLY